MCLANSIQVERNETRYAIITESTLRYFIVCVKNLKECYCSSVVSLLENPGSLVMVKTDNFPVVLLVFVRSKLVIS